MKRKNETDRSSANKKCKTEDKKEAMLVFSSKGANKPAGKSSSKFEHLPNPQDSCWDILNSIPDWRRTLSSFYFEPFKIDGKTFNTAEHFLQFKKISLVNPTLAEQQFCGKIKTGEEARKARKISVLSNVQWEKWEGMIDEVKKECKIAKFGPGTVARKALLATCDAQLWHIAPRCSPVRMFKHELLRDELRSDSPQ